MTGLKYCKSCQENVLISLKKRKLHEKKKEKKKKKSECKFSNLSGEVIYKLLYTSRIAEEASFFQLLYLESYFMVANLVRPNLAVLRSPRNTPMVECHKVAGIHSFNLTNSTPDIFSKGFQNFYNSYYYITPLDVYF